MLLLHDRRTVWPFSACLVASGPTQAILSTVSLDCVFGFKPPETVISVLLHLGAEVYIPGKAPFALKPLHKQEAVAWSLSILKVLYFYSHFITQLERGTKCEVKNPSKYCSGRYFQISVPDL